VSIDGGKVRLRSQIKGVESYWRDYKAVRLQGIYYGIFPIQLVFETGLIVNVFFVPLFVWAMVMMEYGICLKKLAALLLDRKF